MSFVRFGRFFYQPVLPLGKDGRKVTGCKQHLALSKQAADEGTVLLKNDGTLPLAKGSKVCLFGRCAGEFIFGGGGSGDVVTDIRISLTDALKQADKEGRLQLFAPIIDDAEAQVKAIFEEQEKNPTLYWGRLRSRNALPVPEDLYRQAVEFGGTAIFSILRYSSENTFCGDRTFEECELYPEEKAQLERLTQDFEKVVVVIVSCGPVMIGDLERNDKINAILYPMYGGSFAGLSIVDILLGDSYPSGHLQDTFAQSIHDYPGADTFYESEDHVNYTEDIFVGYRWFETFCPEKVVYPFGHGLSYTTYEAEVLRAEQVKNTVSVDVKVTNTGNFPGKEVIQLYLSAPQGKLGKAARVLAAFQKTKELKPGDSQVLKLHFDLRDFASFDDLGKLAESCFVLEKGQYIVSMGVNVRDAEPVLSFQWAEDTVVRRCHSYMAPDPEKFPKRLTADGTYEQLPAVAPHKHPIRRYKPKAEPAADIKLKDALAEDKLDAFLASLTDHELAELLYGHPAYNASLTGFIGVPKVDRRHDMYGHSLPGRGIPPVPTCDGPAGYRTQDGSGVDATFFPAANTVSQTWSPALAEKVGTAGALEAKENNCGIWLTPALNIHRNPLCGRNFEYYSEDPLCAGLFAAATVKGIQSQKVAATIKHFCCNNKEINRKGSDSRLSQRALREIYLRGFEICVKKANNWCLMSSYNLVNGVHTCGNWELLTGILKGEWKYPGVVMTDWVTLSLLQDDLAAGNDVRMPNPNTFPNPYTPTQLNFDVEKAVRDGVIDRGAALEAARRILIMMSHLE